MACYYPIPAYKLANQPGIVFQDNRVSKNAGYDVSHEIHIACRKCVGCRLDQSKDWATRIMCEAQLYEENSFITLTYNETHLPNDNGLHKNDFTQFMRMFRQKLRRKLGKHTKIRFYMCGEYGEQKGRPHFHAIIFGYGFPDKVHHKKSPSGGKLYRSAELEALWPYGHSAIGDVTTQSAQYVARYVMQKQTGDNIDPNTGKPYEAAYEWTNPISGEIITRLPEYNNMSRMPGIGKPFFDKYKDQIFIDKNQHGINKYFITLNGEKMKIPKYFESLLQRNDEFKYEEQKQQKMDRAIKRAKLNPDEDSWNRLKEKETVKKAQINKLKRNLT